MSEKIFLEKPLAILGEEDIILGFRGLGFNTYAVKEPQELRGVLDKILAQRPVVCLVQDNFYSAIEAQINGFKDLMLPILIPFSKQGRIDLLDNILKDIRLRAIGTF